MSYPQERVYNEMLSNRYQIVIIQAAWRERKALDNTRYDGPVTRKRELEKFSKSDYLSNFQKHRLRLLVKAYKSGGLRLKTNLNKSLTLAVSICTLLITQGNTYAVAASNTDHYKLYLHSSLVSEKQYKCAYYVAHTESRWNYKSSNGSHYGLFQMRNGRVKYMNAYQQINLWIKYVAHRYDSKPCKAMSHLKIKGWQ